MKTQTAKNMMTYFIVMLFYSMGMAFASGEAPPVFDSQNHPRSPEHRDIYPEDFLSLDANLSWINRFNGDEHFNEAEMLPRSVTSSSMTHGHEGDSKTMGSMAMDGMGVVKSIRLEQGKVKIAHGPIEKLGMPGMTMVFKVTDPTMLEGLQADDEVQFNIDSSSGGFEITNIRPTGQ